MYLTMSVRFGYGHFTHLNFKFDLQSFVVCPSITQGSKRRLQYTSLTSLTLHVAWSIPQYLRLAIKSSISFEHFYQIMTDLRRLHNQIKFHFRIIQLDNHYLAFLIIGSLLVCYIIMKLSTSISCYIAYYYVTLVLKRSPSINSSSFSQCQFLQLIWIAGYFCLIRRNGLKNIRFDAY